MVPFVTVSMVALVSANVPVFPFGDCALIRITAANGFTRCVGKGELIEIYRAIDVENDAAGILANRLGLLLCQRDVLIDDLHRALGDGALLFPFERLDDGFMHIVRDFGPTFQRMEELGFLPIWEDKWLWGHQAYQKS